MEYATMAQYIGISPALLGLVITILALWSLPWKGYALWTAARNQHVWWFIAIFLVNSAAILEIIYLFGFGLPEKRRRESGTDKSASA
jgi:hypothetical protein